MSYSSRFFFALLLQFPLPLISKAACSIPSGSFPGFLPSPTAFLLSHSGGTIIAVRHVIFFAFEAALLTFT